METVEKLAILADAAKYDASCASSGAERRSSRGGRGIGSTGGAGICHAYTPDGRCVSLLKILLTNFCIFDCAYCVNRVSSDVRRARFSVEEVVALTLDFYSRNYIEGLFLSSGIIRSADYTMEHMVRVARTLREGHDFRGYIHLKTIPDADPALLAEAGRHADRLSINVELPSETELVRLAPQKDARRIGAAMGEMRWRIEEGRQAKAESAARSGTGAKAPAFAPAGQSTQMIVGADGSDDALILGRARHLYGAYRLRRVYYSAFSPIPASSAALPLERPPLMREHRLYQADWLLRHYGFALDEVMSGGAEGMLSLDLDPKLAWALKHRGAFPVDINAAARERLLRVPGLGARNVERILAARRHGALRLADLGRLGVCLRKLRSFIITPDWHPGTRLDAETVIARARPAQQLSLFG